MLKIFSRHELQHGTANTLNVSYRQADRTCATARPQLCWFLDAGNTETLRTLNWRTRFAQPELFRV